MAAITTPHDRFFRETFTRVEIARDFLRHQLPAPLLALWLMPPVSKWQPAIRGPFFDRVSRSSPQSAATGRKSNRWIGIARGLAWILIVFSLARPQWLEPPVEKSQPTRDLLLLVDLSASMVKEDFTDAEGKSVDRLVAVKEVETELV